MKFTSILHALYRYVVCSLPCKGHGEPFYSISSHIESGLHVVKTCKDLPVQRILPTNHFTVLLMPDFTIKKHPPLLLNVNTLFEEFGVTSLGFAILRRNSTFSGIGNSVSRQKYNRGDPTRWHQRSDEGKLKHYRCFAVARQLSLALTNLDN